MTSSAAGLPSFTRVLSTGRPSECAVRRVDMLLNPRRLDVAARIG